MSERICSACGVQFFSSRKPRHFCYNCLPEVKAFSSRSQYNATYNALRARLDPLWKLGPSTESPLRHCTECGFLFDRPGNVGSRSKCPACAASEFYVRNCVSCWAEFTTTSPRNKGNGSCYCADCGSDHRNGVRPPRAPRPCVWCLHDFIPSTRVVSTYCSKRCRVSSTAVARKDRCDLVLCEDCGDRPARPFEQGFIRSLCAPCRLLADTARRNANHALRAAKIRAGDKGITWQALWLRDGGICHLCRKKVRYLPGNAINGMGGTVDHLIPLTPDGTHTWDNVALAHRFCNTSRGNRDVVPVQLLLVG